ncbi:Ubiquitin carboxyl-terminal hydrolase 5 [Lamellibrachia satsuma]|nr:Ubiquitin carboxyl-terminal hydrolase 5 [Lamellibrachia satsuma]
MPLFFQYPQGIRPHMFKTLIGRGHPEFSTKRQQDAQEFILHLLNMTNRNSHGRENPTECLRFKQQERIECVKSTKVNYVTKEEYILALPIPLDAATNKEEVLAYEQKKKELGGSKSVNAAHTVRLRIPLSACIQSYAAPELIEDFYSTALQARSTAKKTGRLASFPDYLLIQLKKFTIGEDWVPKKLDVAVDIPDDLDLTVLRGKGIQPGEEELPAGAAQKQGKEILKMVA